MEKSRVNSPATFLNETKHADFFDQNWVKELVSIDTMPIIEYNFGRLYFGYFKEEAAKRALEICQRRNILVENRSYSFNKKQNCYSLAIICQLNAGVYTPRCSINLGEPDLN